MASSGEVHNVKSGCRWRCLYNQPGCHRLTVLHAGLPRDYLSCCQNGREREVSLKLRSGHESNPESAAKPGRIKS